MAHANRADNSFQGLPPLLEIASVQRINHPLVAPGSGFHLGAFTGASEAICAYPSPRYPGLVAFDCQDWSVLWASPIGHLMGGPPRRRLGHVLIANLQTDGRPAAKRVFAGNPAEFVAYSDQGQCIWRRSALTVSEEAPKGIGGPISLSYDDAGELVAATDEGWIVKFDPSDGSVVDASRLTTGLKVHGRVHPGTFVTEKSVSVVGDVLYLVGVFRAASSRSVPPELSPVCLIRVDLRQPAVAGQEERVRPFAALWDPAAVDSVAIGVNRSGGSPSTWRAGGGRTLVFTNAERFEEGCFRPVIFAVQDKAGVLSPQWWCLLDVDPGDGIHAAPAFHEDSRTLLVTTTRSIFVFHGADQLEGEVPCPEPIDPASLLAGVAPSRGWEVWAGSPFALSFDEVSGDIVGYTNLRLTRGRGGPSWSYMGAFVLPIGKGGFPRPLWSFPLATPDGGLNAQGPGTFGQPALFLYESERGCSVGMAVTSVRTGTYVVR